MRPLRRPGSAARRVGAAGLLVLAACGGVQLENFGSPRPIGAETWRGWCAVRRELTGTLDAYFVRQTLTRGEFVNAVARLQVATTDWGAEARRDGAQDVATLLGSLSDAIGHTKVAVDVKGDTLGPRRELSAGLAALPPCPGQTAIPTVAAPSPSPSSASPAVESSGAPADCRSSILSVSIALDRSTYDGGQTVRATLTARNTSSETCTVRTNRCLQFVQIGDASGTEVWTSSASSACPAPESRVLDAHATTALSFSWDQTCTPRDCTGRVPPGRYTAIGSWTARSGRVARSKHVEFTIRESPTPEPTSSPSGGGTIIPSPGGR